MMMTSDGPPDNDEKGGNNGIYEATTTIFLAIKLNAFITMSA